MPLPAYIICCDGVSIDKDANKATLFSINEQIPIILTAQLQQAGQSLAPAPMRILSVWMRESGDLPDTQFENQLVLHFPEQNEVVIANTLFSFVTTFNRILTPPIVIPGFPGPGILKIESRLRKAGDSEWKCRQFFYVELVTFDISGVLLPHQVQPPTTSA
jgi:hypothetical protein